MKTEFGYHIIQPLGDDEAGEGDAARRRCKASIKQQLAQTKKNEAMTKWVDDLKKDYEDKVSYAAGFTPPPDAKSTTTNETE